MSFEHFKDAIERARALARAEGQRIAVRKVHGRWVVGSAEQSCEFEPVGAVGCWSEEESLEAWI
ncbi:MAG: hypothetical protein HY749_10910 [Gammaproteobacteria bacterium]|nr:hypothetical protein [Gammaproteobacteria bacterium]MBI5616881.1 hypothetical protein [Gammaproteobacteria bacterium]